MLNIGFFPSATPKEMLITLLFPKEDSFGKAKHMLLWDVRLYIGRWINSYMARSISTTQLRGNTRDFTISSILY